MKLYHGTTKGNLPLIQADGVLSPSYWGSLSMAESYAATFGSQGVVLAADIDENDLEINSLVANSLYENGDIDEMPAADDLNYSIDFLEGVVCTKTVFDSVLTPEKMISRQAKQADPDPQP